MSERPNAGPPQMWRALAPERASETTFVDLDHISEEMVVDELQSDSAGYLDMMGERANDLTRDDLIQEASEAIGAMLDGAVIRDGMVTAYREINARRIRYDDLGVFWAWDEEHAEAHWGSGKREDLVRIRAKIAATDIDWLTSAALHVAMQEGELRVRQSAPVHVEATYRPGVGWKTKRKEGVAEGDARGLFAAFSHPDDQRALYLFLHHLAQWMGNVKPSDLEIVFEQWRTSAALRQWLRDRVNPASMTLYHGIRWESSATLPAIGSVVRRPYPILQWTDRLKIARWFAGIDADGSLAGPPGGSAYPKWIGGVVEEAHASDGQIIVATDSLVELLAEHKPDLEAVGASQDTLEMFGGEKWEGEVLTTGAVEGRVIEANVFSARPRREEVAAPTRTPTLYLNTISLEDWKPKQPAERWCRVEVLERYYFDNVPRLKVRILEGPEKGRIVGGLSPGNLSPTRSR